MNNRLKFRLWNKEIGYVENPLIYLNTKGELVGEGENEVYKIDQKAYKVELCTGLKDKNGKLIYEGDIIKTRQHPQNCIMVWFDNDASFSLKSTINDEYYPLYCMGMFEIIGNIHDNPELMEKVK